MEIQASRFARAHRPVGRAGAAARSGPRALGPAPHPPRPRRARRAPKPRRRAPARTRCRPRSPLATREPCTRRTPTGRASRRSTTSSASSRRRPSWNSTAPWRWRWRSVPRPGSTLVDALTVGPGARELPPLPSVRGDLLAKLGRPTRPAPNSSAPRAHPQRPRARPLARPRRRLRAEAGPVVSNEALDWPLGVMPTAPSESHDAAEAPPLKGKGTVSIQIPPDTNAFEVVGFTQDVVRQRRRQLAK